MTEQNTRVFRAAEMRWIFLLFLLLQRVYGGSPTLKIVGTDRTVVQGANILFEFEFSDIVTPPDSPEIHACYGLHQNDDGADFQIHPIEDALRCEPAVTWVDGFGSITKRTF